MNDSATAGPRADDADLLRRALELLDAEGPDSVEWEPNGGVSVLPGGTRVVFAREYRFGLPVLDSSRSVRFEPDGDTQATGRPSELDGTPETEPVVSPEEAVHEALARIFRLRLLPEDVPLHAAPATVVGRFAGPGRHTVLRQEGLDEPVLASLVLAPRFDGPPLRWEVRFGFAGGPVTAWVPARDGGEVECRRHASQGVFARVWGGNPAAGRAQEFFPPAPERFPLEPGQQLPDSPWLSGQPSSDRDFGGNNVRVKGAGAGKVSLVGDGPDRELCADGDGVLGQATLNAFYWCNFLHHLFAVLGFDEAAGNFQNEHAGGLGRPGDPVVLQIVEGFLGGTGEFHSKPDGSSPTLKLGMAPARHAAADPHVVIHEYCHGVVNRLVDGPQVGDPLRGPQPEALGEGFCDYFAVSILEWCADALGHDPAPSLRAWGSWALGLPSGYRSHSYRDHPGHYRDLLALRDDEHHRAGEVWAATLLDLEAVLCDQGREEPPAAWRIAIGALGSMHQGADRGPHFVHARDSWLASFDRIAGTDSPPAALRSELLAVFAARGLGPDARSDGVRFREAHPSG